ncbi:MAG: hypothetical protein KY443_07265 [Actinobacteria bacterium]|nr:hypothetical protein [Actinomycetota bacterium]
MKKLNRTARAIVLPIVGSVLWATASPPAEAECLRAQLEVRRWNDSNITVLSEHDCIYATSWAIFSEGYNDHDGQMPPPVPDGTPNGYEVGYWLPFP